MFRLERLGSNIIFWLYGSSVFVAADSEDIVTT